MQLSAAVSINEVANNDAPISLEQEIAELKRVTRQCPFSGGQGFGGPNGTNPQAFDVARLVLNAMNGGQQGQG